MNDQPTADAVSREVIATALYEHSNPGHRWADAHPHDRALFGADADAVLAVILPATRAMATLARQSEADVQRVIALYERWVKAGPPPIGAPLARWWDARLRELRDALKPPEGSPPSPGEQRAETTTLTDARDSED